MVGCIEVATRVAWVIAVLALVWAYLRWFEWKNIYYPTRTLEATPASVHLDYEDVTFITDDGHVLHGWWIPHGAARGTILHCHGNAGNIGDRVWLAADLHRLAVNVFLFDYRGYGRSRGLPTEQGTYEDARAAYEVIRARYDDMEVPPVIVHGESLGGAVAIQLALDKPVAGLVIESTFSSTLDMAATLYPWLPARALCRFRYDSVAKVGRLRVPKLFAHSRDDEMIPYALAEKLYDAAAEPKARCDLEGAHNDAGWNGTPAYWEALQTFVDNILGPARTAQ